ncbi:hypothetical protein V6N11_047740 [Hibiscus sabdariffa]|uniref:Uncharacterized protein n=2 Tax=Hibiscus sabdariffa TaxID=183260 RepID=A0ABR2P7U3_9ROSI
MTSKDITPNFRKPPQKQNLGDKKGGGQELSGLNGLCRLKTLCGIHNVGGVARVEKRICGFGPLGVGEVLRDHSGNVLLKFSNSIGFADPASAELLAIKKALSLFTASGLAADVNLQVETDCNNVVAWFRQPSKTLNAFKGLVLECLTMHKELRWELVLVDRSKNSLADRLVKMGIDGNVEVGELSGVGGLD